MIYAEVKCDIRGSILKRQHLEAFLLQGAYIESMLRMYADYSLYIVLSEIPEGTPDLHIAEGVRKEIRDSDLFRLIRFLKKNSLVDEALGRDLNKFRKERNQIIHNLFKNIAKSSFKEDLKTICALGTTIIENDRFEVIASILEKMDKLAEDELNQSFDDTEEDHSSSSS